jgi:sterol desaturase/sphingolipid hydroxylase (fatty acid hydroxylase superfamily)
MREGAVLDKLWQRWLSVTLVPGTVAGGLALAVWMMRSGFAPAAVLLPIGLGSLVLVAIVERILPWHRDWNRPRGDLLTDALYLPTQQGVGRLCAPLVAGLAITGSGWITAHTSAGLWPSDWPIAAQVVLASVVREFFDYWGHRAMHRFDWLWRLHATHHSARRLYFLNGARAHPGEIAFRFGILGVLPLAMLGVGETVLVLTTVAALCADVYQHANIAFRLGPLSWLYSIGDAHRWHHSREREEADSNYGNVYIIWDTIFGTRYLPRDLEPPTDVGIEGLDAFPRRFFAQWFSPFRWSAIERESEVTR